MPEEVPHRSRKRLDSWKEVAGYLRRDVATVRRWEKREGLPVHRHQHDKLGSVYAYTDELDAWSNRRQQLSKPPVPRSRRLRTAWVIALSVVLATIAGVAYLRRDVARTAGQSQRVRIAVHRPGTVAGLVAAGLEDALRRGIPDASIEVIGQPGMMSTLAAMAAGKVDLGLAFNLVAFHAAKTDQVLGHASSEIAALTVAYATPAQVVVRHDSDIASLTDLKGKRVSLGIAESGERFCSQILLSHMGFGPVDLSERLSDFGPSLDDLRAGRIDAYITWRGMPVPDLSQAFASGEFRLVAVDAESLSGLRLKHPFLVPWTIPARVYPHQTAQVSTVSARILLLAARSLSPDLAEQILLAIEARMPDLVARHPAAADINVKRRPTLDEGLSIDLHPGAERFFRSASMR